jgi:uncharacterized protein HemY
MKEKIMNDLAEMFINLVLALMVFFSLLWLAHAMLRMFLESKPFGANRTFVKRTLTVRACRAGIRTVDELF